MTMPFLVLFLLAFTQAVYLPIKPNRPRCLSEYLLGGVSSSIKIKINFPKLEDIQPGEHFTVTIRNTESQKIESYIVQPGDKYAKEADLDKNVIYEVCTVLKSERELEVQIEYSAESLYNHDNAQVQVPKSLLTKSDMQGAFVSAAYLAGTLKEYTEEHKSRAKEDTNAFLETEKLNHKLTILNGIEIVVIIAAGLYQFFTLRNYLSSRQYI